MRNEVFSSFFVCVNVNIKQENKYKNGQEVSEFEDFWRELKKLYKKFFLLSFAHNNI